MEWAEMKLSVFLTSAGINIGVCVLLLILYSVLRKQRANFSVYFGRRLAQVKSEHDDLWFERFVPSPSWIVKAWKTTEEEILEVGGLDAVVFLRIIVFSIRIFSVAVIICICFVLPLNCRGREMDHINIASEPLDVFTIGNVKERSRWLLVHCLALYLISCYTCILLYFNYRSIAKMRLAHVTGSPSNLGPFTILVRAIPRSSSGESYNDILTQYFTTYYASSYLSHQMVYRSGTVQKLMTDAEKSSTPMPQGCGSSFRRCGLCGGTSNSLKITSGDPRSCEQRSCFSASELKTKECAAALVFFRTRHDALVASLALQSPSPMLWVTDMAPEPEDVYWKSLYIPYRRLWIRRTFSLVGYIIGSCFFLAPVTFIQGLVRLDKLQNTFPFLRGIIKRNFLVELVTGYLPSVILVLFLYAISPIMLLLSRFEGAFSRSSRKKSACCKVLCFLIWNVFVANILTGTVIDRLSKIRSPVDVPTQLAKVAPQQAFFFTTYVLTSGWTSLACELLQPFGLIRKWLDRVLFKNKGDLHCDNITFPYQTEIPRLLLFGLLGLTFSIVSPLILPFLLVYFFLAYMVYCNQILNVYANKYQTGGLYWPIAHNATIFSLVLAQIIALGIFGLKRSKAAFGFIIPLIICTLLFNKYCRQRFSPIFKTHAAQVLVEMDSKDEQSGKMEEIHQKLRSAYCQLTSSISASSNQSEADNSIHRENGDDNHRLQDPEDMKPENKVSPSQGSSVEHFHLEIEELKPENKVSPSQGSSVEHSHLEIEELKPDSFSEIGRFTYVCWNKLFSRKERTEENPVLDVHTYGKKIST